MQYCFLNLQFFYNKAEQVHKAHRESVGNTVNERCCSLNQCGRDMGKMPGNVVPYANAITEWVSLISLADKAVTIQEPICP
ncbi:hypothetical protein XELAEV_18009218mg [Xenopus laevis]|uniref:Uncharacterized protein n=1 Tax=Xenopus laevis TaxID=8355 RepID=A0A974DS91_XENLA|nr:hypothetical protein XELAEV_18009218mg [Xenopus laevis]